MAEWLERAVGVWEVWGSIPGRGEHKTFANAGGLLTLLVSAEMFRKQRFRTIKTYDTKPRTTFFTNAIHFGTRS